MYVSTRLHGFAQFLTLLACAGAIRAEQEEQPIAPNSDNTVLLIYDEQNIPDAERARICALLSHSVDEKQWPEVQARKGENVWGVVDKFFEVFKDGYQSTTHTIVREIKKVNDLKTLEFDEDTDLRIPPCPVRGYAQYDYPGIQLRTYRPSTQGYYLTSTFSDLKFSDEAKMEPASEMKHERAIKFTATELDLNRLSSEQIRRLKELPNVTYRSPNGYARIRLYRQDDAQCGDPKEWLEGSPYLPLIRQRLAALTEAQKQELESKAKRMPLVVLDWNVEPAGQGHGAKVESAAAYLLHSLELDYLSSSIKRMDLYPSRSNQERLLEWLRNFKKSRSSGWKVDPLADQYKDAERWIRNPPQMEEGAIEYQVPEVLIEALFSKLGTDRAWVNFSFALYSPALRALPDNFVMGLNSFAFVAAGNTPVGLTPDTVPQDSASTRLNLINITYGPANGGVWGSFSDTNNFHTVVSLVAPGCGFAYGSLVPEDRGSSFATPYVAVSSWLKYLLDDVGVQDMRRWLILGSRPVPSQKEPVESQGKFDPARLLSFPHETHFVDQENNVVLVTPRKISLSILLQDGHRISFGWNGVNKKAGVPLRSIVIYSDEHAQLRALLREVSKERFPQVNVQDGHLEAIKLTLIMRDGRTVTVPDAAKFIATMKELCF
jgi:hypothetical protein